MTSGTVFENTKLPLTVWFLAMHLLTQAKNNVAGLELSRHLGVCYRTAWLIKHKLMEVMRHREDGRQLTGRIEMDDACLGGERHGGTAGRGSENKVSFIAPAHPLWRPSAKWLIRKGPKTKKGPASTSVPKTSVDPRSCDEDQRDRRA